MQNEEDLRRDEEMGKAIHIHFPDKGVVTHWIIIAETMDDSGALGLEFDMDNNMTPYLMHGMLGEVDNMGMYKDEDEEEE